jgi:tetratricopeptide (TPR) repeat protein
MRSPRSSARAVHRGYRAVYGPMDLHEAVVLVTQARVYYRRQAASKEGDALMTSAGAIYRRVGIDLPIGPPERDAAKLISQLEQLAVVVRRNGETTESMFDAEHALGSAYLIAEQPGPALQHYRRAAELSDALKIHTDKTAFIFGQIASILIDQKQYQDAVEPSRRALAEAQALGIDLELASALNVRGRVFLEMGDPAKARPLLQRALAIRIRINEEARFRGMTRFLLARALWSSDRAQAMEMAHAARSDLQGFLDSSSPAERGADYTRKIAATRIGEIEQWLTEHRL